MADQRTPRRWEGKETQDGKRDIPEKFWDMGYEKWRDRYRTTNVPMSTLKPRKEVQDGFPVGPNGERLDGFFDAGYHARELRQNYAESGLNERGIRAAVVGDLQRLYKERRTALDSTMPYASGPDFHRLTLLRDAEKASLEEHVARLRDQPNADQLIETAKDRFADLQAYDVETNHPIAHPDRDLVKAPPTDQERFNWLFGRDTQEHGPRKSPAPSDHFEHDEYNALIHTDRSSDQGVSVRQIAHLPRPANDVDVSVREAIRLDAVKAMEDLKEAQAYAETLKKDMPPTFEPREFKEAPFQPEPDFRPRATEDGERYYRGTLRETGEARMREGDPSSEVVPFARLEGRNGEDWKVFGRGVPMSIKSAGLNEGDDIELRKMNLDEGGRWVAKAHDFQAHDQDQKAEHAIAEATRKEEFNEKEAQRFETFQADALAWKARNPQTVIEERVSAWLDGAASNGEPGEQRERRARPALDRVLGRAAPEAPAAKQDVQPQVKPEVNAPAPAMTGSLADEVEHLRAERDQRLGLNQGARAGAPVPNLSQVAAKAEHGTAAVKPDVEQDQGEGKRQSQGAAGAVGGPLEAEAKPVEHAPEVSNTPARSPAPNLAGLADKLDQRQAQAATPASVEPAVSAKPAVEQPVRPAQALDEPVRPEVTTDPSLAGIGERMDARAQTVAPTVEPKVEAPAVAQAQPQVQPAAAEQPGPVPTEAVHPEVKPEQPVEAKLPNLARIGERLDARQEPAAQPLAETAAPTVEPKVEAVQAVEPKVAPVQPVAEAPRMEAPASAVEQPVPQQAPEQAPAVAQAQAEAVHQPAQQPSREMPVNLPDLKALGSKLSGELKAFNAEHGAAIASYTAMSDRSAARTKALEESRVQEVSQALQPEQDLGRSQDVGGDGMRMRLRHRI
ncbi:TPA: hypothetical protein QDB01_000385 [Burkholderia vietnamiensis]|nr:hypothetical protein [Burkholderia vietnamiensis]